MSERCEDRGATCAGVGVRASRALSLALSVLAALGVTGCGASEEPTTTASASSGGEEARPRRRRRRRPRAETTVASTESAVAPEASSAESGREDAGAASAAEFGTPVASSGGARAVRVQWMAGEDAVQCGDGAVPALVRCPQCPREPENAAIVRAFVAVERSVIRCEPPTRPDGKLPLRVEFANDGTAMTVRFPGVRVGREMGLCLGRAICAARVPNFQNPIATVAYDVYVLVPES